MSKKITMLVLLFCNALVFKGCDAKAFDLIMLEPENCYVLTTVTYAVGYVHGDSRLLYQFDGRNIVKASSRSAVNMHEQSEPSKSLIEKLLAYLDHNLMSGDSYVAATTLQDLPVPASLLFVALWLIGFKLTSQPSPSLNRVEPSRFSKAYIVMNFAKKRDSAPC